MDPHEQQYADAVWSYLLEHSDLTDRGFLFVKFHTESKSQFEGHVRARMRGYHRGDPEEKQKKMLEIQNMRKERHDRWLANRRRGERMKLWRMRLSPIRLAWLVDRLM